MSAKPTARTSVPVSLVREYWRQSRRPLASLAFVLPLLLLYEGGLVLLDTQSVRNGADVWLRQILDAIGFGQYFLLPVLTIAALLAWHHVSRERWQLSAAVVYTMFAECAVLALALVFLGRAQGYLSQVLAEGRVALAGVTMQWMAAPSGLVVGRMLGFVGAGVYEEMLFRLLLVPPVFAGVKQLGAAPRLGVAMAVVLTSLMFAAAHYLGPRGDTFDAFSFSFRFTAGAIFAVLFVYRGFGIAAGTHALYDIFVAVG